MANATTELSITESSSITTAFPNAERLANGSWPETAGELDGEASGELGGERTRCPGVGEPGLGLLSCTLLVDADRCLLLRPRLRLSVKL